MRDDQQAGLSAPEGCLQIEGDCDASGLRVAVVVSRYHEEVTGRLMRGAVDRLVALGARPDAVSVLFVPGAFEIPIAVREAARSGRFHAVVALGCVIRGETSHDRYIASEVTSGIGEIMRETGVPVGFGLLTVNTLKQARDRAGGGEGNKGCEAAEAVVRIWRLAKTLREGECGCSQATGAGESASAGTED